MYMMRNLFNEATSREIKSIDNIFGNFLVNKGLYEEIEITKDNIFELVDLIGGHVRINVFCPKCGETRVFSCKAIPYYFFNERNEEIEYRLLEDEVATWQNIYKVREAKLTDVSVDHWSWTNDTLEENTRIMVFKFYCAMDNTHHLDYIVLTYGNRMMKIGQYPTVADLSLPELKEYRKVMSAEDEKELKRAIGLFASGIGVGSFVYLRRIFERIITMTSKKAIDEGSISEDDFNKARVDEKIKLLKGYLPEVIVNNPIFYGIISKGIHELNEKDCLEYFPVMRSFIMMVLIQKEKIRKEAEERKLLADSLGNIAARVK